MFVISVTGEMGSGKSIVAKELCGKNGLLLSADEIVHDLLENVKSCQKKVIEVFGVSILADGKIDRQKLAQKVFGNDQALKKLEEIMHPLVRKQIEKELKETKKDLAVLDVPLLIEAGWQDLSDALVVVRSTREIQYQRLLKRSNISRAQIFKRIKRQLPVKEKMAYADFVIDNRGTLTDTYKQVDKILKTMRKI